MGLSKMGHIEKTAIKKRLGRLLEKAVKKSRRHYTPTDILAHELGHLKAFSKGPSGLVKPRLFLYGTGPAIGTAASFAVPATGKFSGKRALIQGAGYAPRLAEEAAATYYGLKAMKKLKYISPSMYRKARSNLFKAYGTYATDAAAKSLAVGATGTLKSMDAQLIGYGLAGVAGPIAVQSSGLLGSLAKGVGKGGISSRKQRNALAKAMGMEKNPVYINTPRGLGGAAAPKEIISEGLLKALGSKKSLRSRAKDGGLIVSMKRTKSHYTGKRTITDKALDSLESFAKKLQK